MCGTKSTGAVTVNVCVTLAAAAYVPLPPCNTVTVTLPTAPVNVRVEPASVAGPVMAYETARPLSDVAFSAKGASVVWCAGIAGKVIVWGVVPVEPA